MLMYETVLWRLATRPVLWTHVRPIWKLVRIKTNTQFLCRDLGKWRLPQRKGARCFLPWGQWCLGGLKLLYHQVQPVVIAMLIQSREQWKYSWPFPSFALRIVSSQIQPMVPSSRLDSDMTPLGVKESRQSQKVSRQPLGWKLSEPSKEATYLRTIQPARGTDGLFWRERRSRADYLLVPVMTGEDFVIPFEAADGVMFWLGYW